MADNVELDLVGFPTATRLGAGFALAGVRVYERRPDSSVVLAWDFANANLQEGATVIIQDYVTEDRQYEFAYSVYDTSGNVGEMSEFTAAMPDADAPSKPSSGPVVRIVKKL